MSAELNERLFQMMSVAAILFNAFGVCTKANRDVADLFFLEGENGSNIWVGKHASEIFGQNNPILYQMWERCVITGDEQMIEPLAIYPWMGEADGTLRSVRVVPFTKNDDGKPIGTVFTFSNTSMRDIVSER